MKKFLKQLAALTIVFIILNTIVNYIYQSPANKAIANKTHKNYLKWNDIHSNKNKYDLIILGSSRAYTAYNPSIIDSILQIKSYNMGTSAQDIGESYYTLKEILDYQKPKYIVLDLFLPSSDNDHDYNQVFSNASFFNSNRTKYNLVVEGFGTEGILNYSIPLFKFSNHIKRDFNSLMKTNKNQKTKTNWISGFLHDTVVVTDKQIQKFKPISNFDNVSFNKQRFNKYLNKIKKLLEANNIKLICVRSPYPPSRFKLNKTDEEGVFFERFSKENSLPFYDFNYPQNKGFFLDEDFSDYHHANFNGARKVSIKLGELIKSNSQPY